MSSLRRSGKARFVSRALGRHGRRARIHMVEVGGSGGVYYHALGAARALADDGGVAVTLHTALDAEEGPTGFDVCRCIDWRRGTRPPAFRKLLIIALLFLRTVPHLSVAGCRRDAVLHLQGATPLNLVLLPAVLVFRRRFIYTPHNVFSRSGSRVEERIIRLLMKLAASVCVFSKADAERAARIKVVGVLQLPLIYWIRPPRQSVVDLWRTRLLQGQEKIALMPGQIRIDKNPELFIDAIASLDGTAAVLAGENKGGLTENVARKAEQAGCLVLDDYLSSEDFNAVIAAADVVVAPYRIASQSAVLEVARQLGIPSVATDVGGLREIATVVIPPDAGREVLAAAINDLIKSRPTTASGGPGDSNYVARIKDVVRELISR